VAQIASQASNLIFDALRYATLRKIVVAANPIVVLATGELAKAETVIHRQSTNNAHDALDAATDGLAAAVEKNADEATIRDKQDKVFAALALLKQQAGITTSFERIRKAHDDLARAAHHGASPQDLYAAVLELAEAAKTIKQATNDLTANTGAAK